MELQTLIKELTAINAELKKSSSYSIEIESQKIDLIITELKNDLLCNTTTMKSTAKQRLSKALSWHKKQLKACRPVLAYCKYDNNNNQIITNGHFMVFLNETDHLKNIPDYTTSKYQYPSTDILYDRNKKSFKTLDNINLNITTLINMFKLHDVVYIKKDNKLLTGINKESFKDIITFLNINSNTDIKNINISDNYLMNIKTITESTGILCLLKTNDNHLQFLKDDNTLTI